ncbi:exportin family protein [Acinetobacter baumannii]|nr:exportin family protein [Acinetobacter baumannii]
MSYKVFLKISDSTYTQFASIREKLHAGVRESQSKVLGDVLSDLLCEIIEQVFSVLLKDEQDNSTMTQKQRYESEKVLQQILDTFRKYMPWSVSFFGNERLLPLVDYMTSLMKEREQEVYITYPITPQLVQQAQTLTEQIREGNMQSVEKAFQTLIQIVDLGVTSLVREPKKRLKFNLVVDKTLNGVINMTTHLGYKRLEKLGTQVDQTTATHYINHFLAFMHQAA